MLCHPIVPLPPAMLTVDVQHLVVAHCVYAAESFFGCVWTISRTKICEPSIIRRPHSLGCACRVSAIVEICSIPAETSNVNHTQQHSNQQCCKVRGEPRAACSRRITTAFRCRRRKYAPSHRLGSFGLDEASRVRTRSRGFYSRVQPRCHIRLGFDLRATDGNGPDCFSLERIMQILAVLIISYTKYQKYKKTNIW